MFGLGMTEILMILAIALIVVGPQKLPELAKTLGRALGEFKRSAQDLKRSMDIETTVKDVVDLPKTDLKEILNTPQKQTLNDLGKEMTGQKTNNTLYPDESDQDKPDTAKTDSTDLHDK
ncbi:MAG: twin-arginine translocase TatA/TatE family subunit [Pseudomonadota bacterium]